LQREECWAAGHQFAEVAARDTPLHDSPPSSMLVLMGSDYRAVPGSVMKSRRFS
jgi:hypothetical protein